MPVLCRAFGLLVETELPIPGALPASASPAASLPPAPHSDLRIVTGPAALSEVYGSSGPHRVGPEGLLFEKRRVARFLCNRAGDTLVVEALPGASPEEVSAYLIATALPAALWLRGEMMLHAAAAVLPGGDRAVALLGVSGSGKSTILRSLLTAGGAAVAEDSLCLRAAGNSFLVSGLPLCLHLRPTAGPLAADRTLVDVPPQQTRPSAKLSVLVVLKPQDEPQGGDPAGFLSRHTPQGTLAQVEDPERLALLLRHRHRPRIPDLLGLSGGLLPRWAAVARSVPVYSWKFGQAALQSTANGQIGRALSALDRDVVEVGS